MLLTYTDVFIMAHNTLPIPITDVFQWWYKATVIMLSACTVSSSVQNDVVAAFRSIMLHFNITPYIHCF